MDDRQPTLYSYHTLPRLLRMKAGGMIKKMERFWVRQPDQCDQTTTSPIWLGAISTPLVGLLLAIALSVCCCFLERSTTIKASSHKPHNSLHCILKAQSHHLGKDMATHGHGGK